MRWLSREHPELIDAYRELYGNRAYAPASYQRKISEQVAALARKYCVGQATPAAARRVPAATTSGSAAAGSTAAGSAASHSAAAGSTPPADVQLSLI